MFNSRVGPEGRPTGRVMNMVKKYLYTADMVRGSSLKKSEGVKKIGLLVLVKMIQKLFRLA